MARFFAINPIYRGIGDSGLNVKAFRIEDEQDSEAG
jgi:hypothetical protein